MRFIHEMNPLDTDNFGCHPDCETPDACWVPFLFVLSICASSPQELACQEEASQQHGCKEEGRQCRWWWRKEGQDQQRSGEEASSQRQRSQAGGNPAWRPASLRQSAPRSPALPGPVCRMHRAGCSTVPLSSATIAQPHLGIMRLHLPLRTAFSIKACKHVLSQPPRLGLRWLPAMLACIAAIAGQQVSG